MKKEIKHIRVDMDYCSSPVWFSDDGDVFRNGEVEELDISENLKVWLELYRSMWEKEISPYAFNNEHTSNLNDLVFAMAFSLAKRLKNELPKVNIYVWCDEIGSNKLV